ncbi:hypothetical protein [Cognatilysobacter bugurensis]|uniref:Uncharacterized protein n=1 Tax=Cognatilysobacter bugurensis TaxID=543356 RepID=A0A918SXY8_9GAMM|nr:hypothetical protein [Lysobacter bugurensis]GHA77188.1 hypothetical protein GCM10007067_13130 [Lysobacter bugurensis]
MGQDTELVDLLRQVRDQQREQLALQTRALDEQRELFALQRANLERVERIHDRAEALQDRAGRGQRIIVWVMLPLLAFALIALMWPQLRYYLYLLST